MYGTYPDDEVWAEPCDLPEFRLFFDLKVERSVDEGYRCNKTHRFRPALPWLIDACPPSSPKSLPSSVLLRTHERESVEGTMKRSGTHGSSTIFPWPAMVGARKERQQMPFQTCHDARIQIRFLRAGRQTSVDGPNRLALFNNRGAAINRLVNVW